MGYLFIIHQSVSHCAEDHSSWQVALTPAVGLAVEEKVQAEEGKNGFQNGGYLRGRFYGHEEGGDALVSRMCGVEQIDSKKH